MEEPKVRYWNDEEEENRAGFLIEKNGTLALIRDAETGEEDWYRPFEWSYDELDDHLVSGTTEFNDEDYAFWRKGW